MPDSDCGKWGDDFWGHKVISPDELWQRRDEYDKIFVASIYFYEIKMSLLELGFKKEQIVTSLAFM